MKGSSCRGHLSDPEEKQERTLLGVAGITVREGLHEDRNKVATDGGGRKPEL